MLPRLLNTLRRFTAVGLLAAGLAASGPAGAQSVNCKNVAVDSCFRGCDVILFDQCVTGCISGYENNPAKCVEECAGLPFCEAKCQLVLDGIKSCGAVSPKLALVAGTPVYNRVSRAWQQTLRLTNTTLAEAVGNIAVVLEGSANGWNLANATGSTAVLGSGGPYIDLPGVLEPGASVVVQLVYSRTGTLPFMLTPGVFSSRFR